MSRIELQTAYVLHTRPFRDTSLLIDMFTKEYGRISLIAKGARSNKSKYRGVLQAFTPLVVSWLGKSELMTLTNAELKGMPIKLTGHCLYSGIYINELLLRLLHRTDPHPKSFELYEACLSDLQNHRQPHLVLRRFEMKLLQQVGYGLQLTSEAETGKPIEKEHYYFFNPDSGFSLIQSRSNNANVFLGKHLLAINADDFADDSVQRVAKRLMRQAISHLLGNKVIRSRDLFVRYS